MVNGQAVPYSNFASIFRSVFSRTHDLEQPGINQFLGALRQLGVHGKELSCRAVQEAYGSPLPPKVNATAARLAAFRGRVSAGGDGDDEYEQGPQADEEPYVTPIAQRPRPLAAAAAAYLAHAAKSGQYKSLLSIAAEATAAKKASSSTVSSPAAAASSSSGKQQQQKKKQG